MKTVILNTLSTLIFALSLSSAQALAAPLNRCEKLLAGRAFQPTDLVELSVLKDSDATVVSKQSQKGDSPEGRQLILSRTGSDWYSSYISEANANAPQGDPRNLAIIVGGEVAHFLGLSVINDAKMLAPDAKELNFRIEKFNRLLEKKGFAPIPLRFSDADEHAINDESFNRAFGLEFILPYAVGGPLALHDLAYHIPAVAFPAELISAYQSSVEALYKFTEFLKMRAAKVSDEKKSLYNWSRFGLFSDSAKILDTSSGNMAIAYSKIAGDDFSTEEKIMLAKEEQVFEVEALRFFGRFKDPTIESILLDRIASTSEVMYSTDSGPYYSEEEIAKFLFKEFEQFKKQNPQIKWSASLGTFTTAALVEAFDKRAAEFKEALK